MNRRGYRVGRETWALREELFMCMDSLPQCTEFSLGWILRKETLQLYVAGLFLIYVRPSSENPSLQPLHWLHGIIMLDLVSAAGGDMARYMYAVSVKLKRRRTRSAPRRIIRVCALTRSTTSKTISNLYWELTPTYIECISRSESDRQTLIYELSTNSRGYVTMCENVYTEFLLELSVESCTYTIYHPLYQEGTQDYVNGKKLSAAEL